MKVKKFWKVFLSGLIVILFIVSVAYWFVPISPSSIEIDFPAEAVQISNVFFGCENDPIGAGTFRLRESTGQHDIKKFVEDTRASLWRIYYNSSREELIMAPFDQFDNPILYRVVGKYVYKDWRSTVKKITFKDGQIKVTFRIDIGIAIVISLVLLPLIMIICFAFIRMIQDNEEKTTCWIE